MITLQFVRGQDAGGRLIEWFSHSSDFSHVDTVLPNGRLLGARSDRVGGAPPGVQIRDANYLDGQDVLRVELPCDTAMEQSYLLFLTRELGKPYDMEGIAAFVLGRDWRDAGAWFCSELVAYALEKCGYFEHALASPSNKLTPADVLLAVSVKVPITTPPKGAEK